MRTYKEIFIEILGEEWHWFFIAGVLMFSFVFLFSAGAVDKIVENCTNETIQNCTIFGEIVVNTTCVNETIICIPDYTTSCINSTMVNEIEICHENETVCDPCENVTIENFTNETIQNCMAFEDIINIDCVNLTIENCINITIVDNSSEENDIVDTTSVENDSEEENDENDTTETTQNNESAITAAAIDEEENTDLIVEEGEDTQFEEVEESGGGILAEELGSEPMIQENKSFFKKIYSESISFSFCG